MSKLFTEGQLDNLFIASHSEYLNQTITVGDGSQYNINPIKNTMRA